MQLHLYRDWKSGKEEELKESRRAVTEENEKVWRYWRSDVTEEHVKN